MASGGGEWFTWEVTSLQANGGTRAAAEAPRIMQQIVADLVQSRVRVRRNEALLRLPSAHLILRDAQQRLQGCEWALRAERLQ